MTYLGNPYHPWWLDNLAEDATSDGAALHPLARYFITSES